MNETSFGFLMANNGDLIRTKVLGLAAALMVINFIWAVGRTFLVSSDLTTDYTPVVRAIILTIVLTLYSDLLWIAGGMIDYVAGLFSPKDPQEVLASLKAMTAKVDGAFTTANANLWKDFDLSWDTDQMKKDLEIVLGMMNNAVEMIILKLVRLVAEGLTLLVRAFVAKMQVLVVVFLGITGPIAILISMIPGFQGAMAYWFRNLLHAKFWAMTIGVLDNMVNFYVDNLVDTHIDNMMNNATLEERFGAIFNLVVVHYCVMGAYLATPFLTNAFIGGITSAGGLASWAANKGANLPGEAARTAQSMSRSSSGGSSRSRSGSNTTTDTTSKATKDNSTSTSRAEREESYEARMGRQPEPQPNYDAPSLAEGQRRADDDRYDDYDIV
ncbi:hypothetical protein F5984_25455 [Rudanella paleaurantiibacter]|uniref:Uncharacterized protein n=1 Tax=Rudanella paleaurantiibacter TaxID=2614655 RepID=A0A7J5TRX5_9BACT|nr:hypothetical protein [Rudanella paleaurantiibacter]KAB7725838.1 hypothetical protein F5984_25455 [Rudanella paleaurantiibacter]